jgi:hypothetical protein
MIRNNLPSRNRGGWAETFWFTAFILYRVRYVAAIKFSSPPASGAHSCVDIPGVIGKRSIKIVACCDHGFPQDAAH